MSVYDERGMIRLWPPLAPTQIVYYPKPNRLHGLAVAIWLEAFFQHMNGVVGGTLDRVWWLRFINVDAVRADVAKARLRKGP